MSVATIAQLKFTVADAARQHGKTTSRIRQICIEHDIGFKFSENSERRLTDADMLKIGEILEEIGRDFSS